MGDMLKDSVKALLSEYFSGQSPIQIDRSKRQMFAQQIRQLLSHLPYIETDKSFFQTNSNRPTSHILSFVINLPVDFDRLSRNFNEFTLVLNLQDEVELLYADIIVKVSSTEEILRLATACQQLAEKQHAEASKRQKIRHLKKQAILAQIKKLANEEGYTFSTLAGDSDEMSLYIQVGYDDMLVFKLPYQNYAEILAVIKPAIRTMQTLYAMGIDFRVEKRLASPWFQQRWITPEPVEQ